MRIVAYDQCIEKNIPFYQSIFYAVQKQTPAGKNQYKLQKKIQDK